MSGGMSPGRDVFPEERGLRLEVEGVGRVPLLVVFVLGAVVARGVVARGAL